MSVSKYIDRSTIVIILSCFLITNQTQVVSQNVRLKDGDASYQGRLEVKYNGEWGTVCSGTFNHPAATVVCRQFGLGFYSFYDAKPGPIGGRIWLDDVQCNGNEESIFDCTHNGWGNVTDCTHHDDVGLACTITEGAVELGDKRSNELGVGSVQYYQDEFRTLLNFSGWNDNDALVVCRQLGYSTTDYSVCLSSTCGPINCPGGNIQAKLWINNRIDCTGQEMSLTNCPSSTWIPYDECNDTYNAASVKCSVPVQGGWTSWVNAAPCSSLCADGTQTRVRNCTRPTPEYGGEDCIGDSKDTVQCGLDSCVKPKITGASPEQTVISNNTAVFHCNATSKPLADITWLRGGSVLNRTWIKITFSTDGKDCNDDNPNNLCTSYSVLQLFKTQPADSGRYVCNASNDYYSDSHTLYLIVQVAPKIITSPVTQIVKSSSNVTFICTASSKPRATIQWTRNGNELTNSSKIMITNRTEGNCVITGPPDQCVISSTLEIFNTEPPDSGTITCNATNEAGYLEKSAALSVDGTPFIKVPPHNQKFIKFSDVSFICIAIGYDRPEIEWTKHNTDLRSGNKYSIINSELGDCVITECGNSSTLEIFNTTENDIGEYTCNASNAAGNVIITAQLIIEHSNNDGHRHRDKIIVGSCVGVIVIIIIVIAFVVYRILRHRPRPRIGEARPLMWRGQDNGQDDDGDDDDAYGDRLMRSVNYNDEVP